MGNGRVRVTRGSVTRYYLKWRLGTLSGDRGGPLCLSRVPQATRSCRVIKPLILPQIVSVTVGFATTGKYEEEAGRSDRAGEWRGKEFPGEDDKCHVSSHRKVGRGSRAFSCHWPWLSLSSVISLAEEGTLHNTWVRAWENPLGPDKKGISWHKSLRPKKPCKHFDKLVMLTFWLDICMLLAFL